MTEFSWPWECTETGDGGSDSYSLDVVRMTNSVAGNFNQTTSGVVYWTDTTILPFTSFTAASDGLLLPSNPSGNTVRIASGIGIVQGWMYASDGNTDFDVSTAPINSTNLVVLRRDASAQTVRLAYKVAGAPAGTATVTQTAATWEVAIATVTVDGSSNFSALTDSRNFAISPMAASVKLREGTLAAPAATLTLSDIQQDLLHLRLYLWGQVTAGISDTVTLQINGITTATYEYSFVDVSGAGALTGGKTAAANSIILGTFLSTLASPELVSNIIIDIPFYSDTGGMLTLNSENNYASLYHAVRGVQLSAAAVTSIEIGTTTGNLATGFRYALYGVA